MDIMNDPSRLPQDTLQCELLRKSEERLLDSLYEKDIDSVRLFWEIVSFYRQTIKQDEMSRSLSATLNNENDIILMKEFIEGSGDNDE